MEDHKRHKGIAALLALALAQFAPAATCQTKVLPWSPPRYNYLETDKHTVPHPMLQSFRIGTVQIVLEQTRIQDVQKLLGGEIGYQGDAADSESWLCYHATDTPGNWVLWITSDEMHGVSQVANFQWRLLRSGEVPDRRCKLLRLSNDAIELPLGFQLGSKEQQVRLALGQPTAVVGASMYYDHEHPAKFHGESCTVWNGVTIELRNGQAVVIEGGMLSSC